jgi:hypothetical protein
MASNENRKKGLIVLGLFSAAAVATVIAAAAKSQAEGQNGVTLTILDANGNPVVGSSHRGRVYTAGSVLNLVPGDYSAQVTVKNTTIVNGAAGPATLSVNLVSSIAGLLEEVFEDVDFAAGETKVVTYPFTVTEEMAGLSGTITVNILDPNGIQLASDFATVVIGYPEMVVGALTASRLYSTNTPSGVPIGSSLLLVAGEAFWADLGFTYQYKGGNFTFLAEIDMGDGINYWRSYKDITLPDSPTETTAVINTVNQDPFDPLDVAFAAGLPVRLQAIYRGSGSTWVDLVEGEIVAENYYAGAIKQNEPNFTPYIASMQLRSPTSAASFIDIIDGMEVVRNNSFKIKLNYRAQLLYSAYSTKITSTVKVTPPGSSESALTRESIGGTYNQATGEYDGQHYYIGSGSTLYFSNYGAYHFVVTLKYDGVVTDTLEFDLIVPSTIVYGAEVSIS